MRGGAAEGLRGVPICRFAEMGGERGCCGEGAQVRGGSSRRTFRGRPATRATSHAIAHLEISRLVGVVFVDDVHLVILELTKTTEHNITSAHPNL